MLRRDSVGGARLGLRATDRNESMIRVETSREPSRPRRLTLAGVKAMNAGQVDYAFDKIHGSDRGRRNLRTGVTTTSDCCITTRANSTTQCSRSSERRELMPGDPIVFYNLGLALEAAGRVHEAMDLYWQAVEMDPTNPNFLGNLVRLRVRLGENSPEVMAQLQDLMLIETRPDWRRWADRQLAFEMNPTYSTAGREHPSSDGPRGGQRGRQRASNASSI